jgi:hypothetical protein
MSILISGKASYRPLLIYHNFILPDFVLVELDKHKNVLKNKTRMQKTNFSNGLTLYFLNSPSYLNMFYAKKALKNLRNFLKQLI